MSGLGLAGMDRKAMEEERLARARKRQRSISPPPKRESTSAPRIETTTTDLPSGARLMSFSTHVDSDQRGRKSASANAASQQLKIPKREIKVEPDSIRDVPMISDSMPSTKLQYPNGVVKMTWAFGCDRTGDDVKLEEVLEPRTLRTAVLSAFQWDTQWLLAKLKTPPNGGQTKCVFVMQAKEDALRDQMIEDTREARSFLRLCFPSMVGQINCMHSKLMLLFHPDKLRIAIPTANLLPFDWGETGVMENSVFMIDLPRVEPRGKGIKKGTNDFHSELLHYLAKQSIDEDIRESVSRNFDFSATDRMRFIHTVGGANIGDDAKRTGLPGLSQAVRQLNLQSDEGLQIDFAASSIGSLNDDQLRYLHSAARGQNMFKENKDGSSKPPSNFFKPSKSKPVSNNLSSTSSNIRDKIRIYFPTLPTVRASKAGAAGTICLSRKWWEEMRFPRSCFRDYQSTRTGLLSHNKILYARGTQTGGDGAKKKIAWAYVGSANFSESAWGKVVFDKKKGWKVNCRNWECGVLLPVSDEMIEACTRTREGDVKVKKEKIAGEDSETESEDEDVANEFRMDELVGMEVFEHVVRPPFKIPGDSYDGREPWFFQEFQ